MNRSGIAGAVVGAAALTAAGVLAVAGTQSESSSSTETIAGTTAPAGTYPYGTTLAEGWVQGRCAAFLPPEPDPCDAVDGTLRYVALGAFVASSYHPKWVAANPGDYARLSAFMAAPLCSTPVSPQPQIMRTFYGAGLYALVQAIACARHPEPVVWPQPPPPPNPARTDTQPPSAPGAITVTPSG